MVASGSTLEEMATYLPGNLAELEKISGFGKVKVRTYGQQFLDIINTYREENNLEGRMSELTVKSQRKAKAGSKPDTKHESLVLHQQGLSIKEIAGRRNLAVGTIESHLLFFIKEGTVRVEDLVDADKLNKIREALAGFKGSSITPVKDQLGEEFSFGEIRFVLASLTTEKITGP
jgi:ATP-dependent DNA helicase RecQ